MPKKINNEEELGEGAETTPEEDLREDNEDTITNDKQYESAMLEIEHLTDLDPEPRSEEEKRLTYLSALAKAYEEKETNNENYDSLVVENNIQKLTKNEDLNRFFNILQRGFGVDGNVKFTEQKSTNTSNEDTITNDKESEEKFKSIFNIYLSGTIITIALFIVAMLLMYLSETLKGINLELIIFIIFGCYFSFIVVRALWRYMDPENVEYRRLCREEKIENQEKMRIAREEEERIARAKRECEQQQRELERQQAEKEYWDQYRQLRKEIEAMPKYEHWRQEVFEKYGKKCMVCGSIENIEVDHIPETFHTIIRRYRITNVIQAYECSALWDVNNGKPICKLHHDQTKSSVYFREKNP